MAHRDGLRVSYDRPQPPRLALQGRSLPKIIGQVRALRGLWAAEEQRLDEDDLEAFERVERLEQQLAADLEAREAAATQAEKDALGEGRRAAPHSRDACCGRVPTQHASRARSRSPESCGH